MAHKHSHDHSTGNIQVAFFLNLAFTILEIFGGLYVNSIAILSDAVHDLGDSLSLGMAWYLDRYSKRGEDERFSYGYRRFSLLGALINIIVLIVGSIYVLSEAIPRLLRPEQTNAQGMLLFALGGILVNGLAVLRMRGEKSMNARVVFWHLFEDVLGWVAVLLVSIILLFYDLPILDPILSVLITLYILYNVVRNLRSTIALFLQGVPAGINMQELEKNMVSLANVQSCHHTHVWSLDGEHHVLTTHVVIDDHTSKENLVQIKCDIGEMLDPHIFAHSTIELEFEHEDCRMKAAHA